VEHKASARLQQPRHRFQSGQAPGCALGVPERVADAEDQIERGVLQVVGQLVPARAEGSKRNTLLAGGLLGPANHPITGVCGDHVKAKTRETDSELAGSTRAV
jgi:hypothetical protein